jgi:lipoprotein-releasing system ATP-binding protein
LACPGPDGVAVAVARALVHKPALLLADEPTGNLDRHTAQAVGRLLLELHREQRTVLVVVTHSAELAESFPRVLTMDDGALQSADAARSTAIRTARSPEV